MREREMPDCRQIIFDLRRPHYLFSWRLPPLSGLISGNAILGDAWTILFEPYSPFPHYFPHYSPGSIIGRQGFQGIGGAGRPHDAFTFWCGFWVYIYDAVYFWNVDDFHGIIRRDKSFFYIFFQKISSPRVFTFLQVWGCWKYAKLLIYYYYFHYYAAAIFMLGGVACSVMVSCYCPLLFCYYYFYFDLIIGFSATIHTPHMISSRFCDMPWWFFPSSLPNDFSAQY